MNPTPSPLADPAHRNQNLHLWPAVIIASIQLLLRHLLLVRNAQEMAAFRLPPA